MYDVNMKTKTTFKKGHKSSYTATGKNHHQFKHGMGSIKNRHPLYQKWSGMKRRCLNKNDKSYPRYGGSGVVISKPWNDFNSFYEDMSTTYFPKASLDRIDNSKGYSKDNCRWVTLAEQGKNKTTVPLYSHNGLTMTSSDWDKKLGFRIGTVRARILHYHWDIQKALTKGKKKYSGVFKDNRGKWRVEVKRNRKQYFVGRFDTFNEAKKARASFLYSLLKA